MCNNNNNFLRALHLSAQVACTIFDKPRDIIFERGYCLIFIKNCIVYIPFYEITSHNILNDRCFVNTGYIMVRYSGVNKGFAAVLFRVSIYKLGYYAYIIYMNIFPSHIIIILNK